jgi:hypothetical protein
VPDVVWDTVMGVLVPVPVVTVSTAIVVTPHAVVRLMPFEFPLVPYVL